MPATSSIKAGRAFVEMSLDATSLERGLRRSSKRLKSFGASMTQVGRKIVGLTAAVAAPIALSTKIFAKFDDNMRAVKAVTGATDAEFKKLTDTAKLLGRTTSFTAGEVAQLMTELGRAGFDPTQIDAMTAAVLNLARATGTDAAQAAGVASATLRQFGLEAEQAGRVADVLTAGANKSFNTLDSLGEALKFAGPVAADANMSLEDTVAILGALGNVGIQGSNAGSALRRLLVLSASEAEKFGKVFGVATKDAAGNARPLIDILSDIDTATADLGSADRSAKFAEAFGLLGVTAASSLSKGTEAVFDLREQLDGVQGLAAKTAEEMDGGIGGASRRLLSALEGIAIAIGGAVAGPLSAFAEKLSKVAGYITKLVENNREFVASLVKVLGIALAVGAGLIAVGGSIGILGVILGGLATALSVIVGVAVIAAKVIAAIIVPVTILIGAVLLLGGAILHFTDWVGQALSWLGKKWDELYSGVMVVVGGIVDALKAGDIQLAAKILWLGLKLAWAKGLLGLERAWDDFKKNMLGIADNGLIKLGSFFVNAISKIRKMILDLLSFISGAWSRIALDAASAFSAIIFKARTVGAEIAKAFNGDFDAVAVTSAALKLFSKEVREINESRRALPAAIQNEIESQLEQANAPREETAAERRVRLAEDELEIALKEAERLRRGTESGPAGESGPDAPPTPSDFDAEIKNQAIASREALAVATVNPTQTRGTFDARAAGDIGGRGITEGERRLIEYEDKKARHNSRVERLLRKRQGVAT